MTILTGFGYLHLSLKKKDISPKELYRDFSYTLAYLTLIYERNRIFHPCREILNLSNFYRQAFLNIFGSALDKSFLWLLYMQLFILIEGFILRMKRSS